MPNVLYKLIFTIVHDALEETETNLQSNIIKPNTIYYYSYGTFKALLQITKLVDNQIQYKLLYSSYTNNLNIIKSVTKNTFDSSWLKSIKLVCDASLFECKRHD